MYIYCTYKEKLLHNVYHVLNSEVFIIQRLLSTQIWDLGQMKVSCLYRGIYIS